MQNRLQALWQELNKRLKALVIALLAGVLLILFSGFSRAETFYYGGEEFSAGSLFLPDKYEYNLFADDDMNDAYNWLYGQDDEELKYLNGELAKLRYKKIGGLLLGGLLVGGAGYQLRREEDFKKALAKLV